MTPHDDRPAAPGLSDAECDALHLSAPGISPRSTIRHAYAAGYAAASGPPREILRKHGDALQILASIWQHGDWKAETYNERQLESLMRELGHWPWAGITPAAAPPAASADNLVAPRNETQRKIVGSVLSAGRVCQCRCHYGGQYPKDADGRCALCCTPAHRAAPVPAPAAAVAVAEPEPEYCRQHGGDGKRGRACPECLRYELSQRLPNHPDATPEPAPAATGNDDGFVHEILRWRPRPNDSRAETWIEQASRLIKTLVADNRRYCRDVQNALTDYHNEKERADRLEVERGTMLHDGNTWTAVGEIVRTMEQRAIAAEGACNALTAARDQAVALLRKMIDAVGNLSVKLLERHSIFISDELAGASNDAATFLAQADAKGSKGAAK